MYAFSLRVPLPARYFVFTSGAPSPLRGRRRILKATITAQNYQFPRQLTLWEDKERGRERGEQKKGMKNSNLGWRRPPSLCTPPLQGAVMCLGWEGRELQPLRMNLTLPSEVKQVTTARAPQSSLPVNRPGLCSTPMRDCMLIGSTQTIAQICQELKEAEEERRRGGASSCVS